MTKPILLLDVDGVLNVIGKHAVHRKVLLPWTIRGEVFQKQFFPVPLARPFLHFAWRNFEVYWLTAWREMANSIAAWAELPDAPVLIEPLAEIEKLRKAADRKKTKEERAEGYLWIDWKAEAAKKRFKGERRRIVWLEDGISEAAHEWLDSRKRVRYVGTNSFVGLTMRHVRKIVAFARVEDSLSSLRREAVEGRG